MGHGSIYGHYVGLLKQKRITVNGVPKDFLVEGGIATEIYDDRLPTNYDRKACFYRQATELLTISAK